MEIKNNNIVKKNFHTKQDKSNLADHCQINPISIGGKVIEDVASRTIQTVLTYQKCAY